MSEPDNYYPQPVREYVRSLYATEDDVLRGIGPSATAAGVPSIAIGPDEGRFLQLIGLAIGARRALEIGTLAGYSGVWIARGLAPDGLLVTVEADPRHAEVAGETFRRAGLASRTDIRVGPALQVLPTLASEPPFDLVFIDAAKDEYPDYLDWALKLTRPGAVIAAHNVFRRGEVVAPSTDPLVESTREFNRRLADDPRLASTLLPLRDGLSFSIVR